MDNLKNDFYYAKRILKSIEVVSRYLKDKSLDDLYTDGFLLDAIENRFTKIAEDSNKLSKEFKNNLPSIPWSAISTIRNKVCHDYDVVDAGTLYKTIKVNFNDFKKDLLKSINFHKMKLISQYFKKIESGEKRVELRLYDEKRKSFKIGDLIVFRDIETNEELIAEIIDLQIFDTFEELYSAYKKTDLGYAENDFASPNDMNAIYDLEKIKKYGVVAIEIKLF